LPKEWVDRDDRVAGDCPAGPVTDDEPVARLLTTRMWVDGKLQDCAFEREHLIPPKGRAINNTPGHRDGESLIRNRELPDAKLTELSAPKPNSEGAAIFDLAAIRQIVAADDASRRMFRVYEDPTDDLPQHAVIRFAGSGRPEWYVARSALLKTIARKL
jgi:hypothetical protein